MTRRYVDALILYKEREVFIYGIWAITGFVQNAYLIDKGNHSKTTYTLSNRIHLLVNSITSLSSLPLIAIFYIGLIILCISSVSILVVIFQYFIQNVSVEGWTSMIASIWLIGGLIITFMGIIAIYLSKIFIETKNRPLTIIKKEYTRSKIK